MAGAIRRRLGQALNVHRVVAMHRNTLPTDTELARRRVMIVAAHPDDEAIGLGSRLSSFHNLVAIVHVTDGAPRKGPDIQNAGAKTWREYAELRRKEFERALDCCGAHPSIATCLWCPDQEAMYRMALHARFLLRLIRRCRPSYVITHPYEGGHPDHDAVAASVRWAVQRLKGQNQRTPQIVEFACYHNSTRGMETGCFVGSQRPIREKILSAHERLAKQRLYDCYPSQKNVLKQFPILNEPLRSAPAYDFWKPPSRGKLLYEGFGWGIDGRKWRACARKAWRVLRFN